MTRKFLVIYDWWFLLCRLSCVSPRHDFGGLSPYVVSTEDSGDNNYNKISDFISSFCTFTLSSMFIPFPSFFNKVTFTTLTCWFLEVWDQENLLDNLDYPLTSPQRFLSFFLFIWVLDHKFFLLLYPFEESSDQFLFSFFFNYNSYFSTIFVSKSSIRFIIVSFTLRQRTIL